MSKQKNFIKKQRKVFVQTMSNILGTKNTKILKKELKLAEIELSEKKIQKIIDTPIKCNLKFIYWDDI